MYTFQKLLSMIDENMRSCGEGGGGGVRGSAMRHVS